MAAFEELNVADKKKEMIAMPRHSFIQMTKLHNVMGRIDYITSTVKQENLYAIYATQPLRSFWKDLAKCNREEFAKSGTIGKYIEARELIIALPEGLYHYEHLNKAAGGQSAYRGLGSIDFRAAARSVLLIGRVKREPNVRVIVHDKSSLAPEGKPVAFCLDPETGFSWIGEYDITADELLSGAGGNTATKTEQAERLILDLLADGKELASEDIVKAAAEAGISERTVQNAKRNMGGILGARRVGGQWYNFIKKKQPPEPAS